MWFVWRCDCWNGNWHLFQWWRWDTLTILTLNTRLRVVQNTKFELARFSSDDLCSSLCVCALCSFCDRSASSCVYIAPEKCLWSTLSYSGWLAREAQLSTNLLEVQRDNRDIEKEVHTWVSLLDFCVNFIRCLAEVVNLHFIVELIGRHPPKVLLAAHFSHYEFLVSRWNKYSTVKWKRANIYIAERVLLYCPEAVI